MPYQPTAFNFKTSSGTDLASLNLGWITKEYLMTVYPQIANQLITPELWVWGFNLDGRLGNNKSTPDSTQTPITTFAGGSNWKQIAAGNGYNGFSAAIKTDGTLWTWGTNYVGQLGDNTLIPKSTPVTTFAGGSNWKQVSCAYKLTAAIKTDGTLWTWGRNYEGQLGNNTTNNSITPVTTFAGGTNWKQVAAGYRHTAAIKTDGTLWIWGSNYTAQLGNNRATNESLTPITTFAGGSNWKQVACGYYHTAAIKTDGTLWIWGENDSGQLGNNTGTARSTPVTTFAGGTNWKQCGANGNGTVAIKTDGTLWTWGNNSVGQLGNNTTTNIFTPVTTFAGGTNWKQISYGGFHTAAIKTDGTLWTWGRNTNGQLADNTTTQRITPVTTFAGGTNWKQAAAGYAHTAAIKTSDDLQGI